MSFKTWEATEEILILSVFRSAASDVCAQFYAKDMRSDEPPLRMPSSEAWKRSYWTTGST